MLRKDIARLQIEVTSLSIIQVMKSDAQFASKLPYHVRLPHEKLTRLYVVYKVLPFLQFADTAVFVEILIIVGVSIQNVSVVQFIRYPKLELINQCLLSSFFMRVFNLVDEGTLCLHGI
jgi:hypothetical protein